ncbi:MAG: ferrochelatase [Ignavibacteriales bacterium]|nr:ferrochelatase [Ignavibacteriales bacterium]
MKNGDPYSGEIRNTMEVVMKMRSYSHNYHLSFQSKVGPKNGSNLLPMIN